MDYYNTNHEQIQELVISPTMRYYPRILYSIEIDDLQIGDILMITSAYEATNEQKYTVMVASNIILTQGSIYEQGMILDESRGYNLTKVMHHGVMVHSRQYQITTDMPGKNFINTMIWSASWDANKQCQDRLKIEKGYGHLDVVVFHQNGIFN